jgi:choline-glycine betaine transporter
MAEAGCEEAAVLDGLREAAQEQLGASFQHWALHSFSTQVVAGLIYMMRVQVDDGEVLHVKVVKPLPHTKQPPSIMKIDRGKTLDDEFDP